MGADEAGTLAQLKEIRSELLDKKIAEHRDASSRVWVTAFSRNFRVSSAPLPVRRRYSAGCKRATRACHRIVASNSASVSTLATSLSKATTSMAIV
jgi:hypothetical protein